MKRFSGRILSPRCGTAVVALLGISLMATALPAQSADREAQAWRHLVRVLDSANRTSRLADLRWLIQARPPGLPKVLEYLGEHESDPDIQSEAILGLAKLKDPTSEPALRRIRAKLGDPNPQAPDQAPLDFLRIYTLAALYRMTGESGLREQLLSFLPSPSISQASAAVRALSLLREAEVREALYALIPAGDYLLACQAADYLLDDQNTPEVRRRLREAIHQRPVVEEPIRGQQIRETCIDAVLLRLAKKGIGVSP